MILLVMTISVLSLAFAVYLARFVLAADEGTPEMKAIANAIRKGRRRSSAARTRRSS